MQAHQRENYKHSIIIGVYKNKTVHTTFFLRTVHFKYIRHLLINIFVATMKISEQVVLLANKTHTTRNNAPIPDILNIWLVTQSLLEECVTSQKNVCIGGYKNISSYVLMKSEVSESFVATVCLDCSFCCTTIHRTWNSAKCLCLKYKLVQSKVSNTSGEGQIINIFSK